MINYDLQYMEMSLKKRNTELVHEPTMTSTIDVALQRGLKNMVVLTEHQSRGRGRYGRVWRDETGASLLVTFVKVLPNNLLPPVESLLLSHLFVLAVWQALCCQAVKIRWPNDLFAFDKKLGGSLVSNGICKGGNQAVLFSIGINLEPVVQGSLVSISLSEITPRFDATKILLAIDERLNNFLSNLPRLGTTQVYLYYENLWYQASALIGREICIEDEQRSITGEVVDSPLGGNLLLKNIRNDMIELKEYGRHAHIKLL